MHYSICMIYNSLPGDIANILICDEILKVSFFQVLAECLELSKPVDLHQKCLCADDLQGNNKTHILGKWLEQEASIPNEKYVEVLKR